LVPAISGELTACCKLNLLSDQVDENVAAEDWYDPGRRWLTAGTIELVLRGTVLLTELGSTSRLARNYDIDSAALREIIKNGKGKPFLLQFPPVFQLLF
jgi:hypothetical protein